MDQQLDIFTNQIDRLSLVEASQFLEISPATLRNWIKSGLTKTLTTNSNPVFEKSEIQALKDNLRSGQLNRLKKRANKNTSQNILSHVEILKNPECETNLVKFFEEIKHKTQNKKDILYFIYLNQLENCGLIKIIGDKENYGYQSNNDNLNNELSLWRIESFGEPFFFIKNLIRKYDLSLGENLLSYCNLYLESEGAKQKRGAYYTPISAIDSLVWDTIEKIGTVLDPCCGGGDFLLSSVRKLQSIGCDDPWRYVHGYDIDEDATLVCRANLTLYSNGKVNTAEQIRNMDTLVVSLGEQETYSFDYILTNPPWGALLSDDQKRICKTRLREVTSKESFSYFLLWALNNLKCGGRLGFVLPEAFLNIDTHSDIRSALFKKAIIISIRLLKERFAGVFTKAISLVAQKEVTPASTHKICIITDKKFFLDTNNVITSPDKTISLASDELSSNIISQISHNHKMTLKGHASWALGIVTGDNNRFLSYEQKKGMEPIIKGQDVYRFKCGTIKTFIDFKPDQLQQVAPINNFRSIPKLIYRFICKELVFAFDDKAQLTLNSANILIPSLPRYNSVVLCGVLNSCLLQFYYQKRFNVFKTIRGNLEKIPFPSQPNQNILKKIESCTERLISAWDDVVYDELNEIVFNLYGLDKTQRRHVEASTNLSGGFIWRD